MTDKARLEERTNKCLPLIALIIFRDRSTSCADSGSFVSAVWLLDPTTAPRSSNVPISLYWCNPWNLVECVVSSIFRYSLLMISTTDISRDAMLVGGWKQAEVLVLGEVLADISTVTGKVSNTTRLQSEASCYLIVSIIQCYSGHFCGLTSSKNWREKATQPFILPWEVILIRLTGSSFAVVFWSIDFVQTVPVPVCNCN